MPYKNPEDQRAWRERNRERQRAYTRNWYQANRDQVLADVREYRLANPEKIRSQKRADYRANRETYYVRYRAWVAANRDRNRANQCEFAQRRRTKLANIAGQDALATLTRAEWQESVASFAGRCAYCQRVTRTDVPRSTAQKRTKDHIVPVEFGGGYTKDNIVPACAPCNSAKGTKFWMTFQPVYAG